MEKVVCLTNTSVYFGFIFIYLFDKPGKQPLSETSELDSIGNLYTRFLGLTSVLKEACVAEN